MNWEITGQGGFGTLDIQLTAGERFFAQPRSLLQMTTGVEVTAKVGGNIDSGGVGAAFRGMLAGESFATAIYSASRAEQSLSLAPDVIGPILSIELEPDRTLNIAKGSYLANTDGVTLSTKFSGVKGILAKKGIFLIVASGAGTIFLTAAGDIRTIELGEGEKTVIDNDHVVAFDSTISYQVVIAAKGLKDSVLSGEGLLIRYTGPGKVYFQTRKKARSGVFTSILNTMT